MAVAVCGIKCIDLTKECLKIIGICYLYNQRLKLEKNILKGVKKWKRYWSCREGET